jgi:CBS domain-containing protein
MRRDVSVVREEESLLVAARLMREHDIGFLPVVDARGALAGVLTDRDLVVRGCVDDAPPSQIAIASVMTRGAMTCRPDDPITLAESRMRTHRVTRVVIVEAHRAPIGVLSLSDISQYQQPSRIGRIFRRIAERKYAPRP